MQRPRDAKVTRRKNRKVENKKQKQKDLIGEEKKMHVRNGSLCFCSRDEFNLGLQIEAMVD